MKVSAPTTISRGRRVQLTPARSVPVGFTGRRAATGPQTLGQLNILQWLSVSPGQVYATVYTELDVSEETSVDDVVEAMSVLLARHEGLRTTYEGGTENPTQKVAKSGTLVLDVCTLNDGRWGPCDRATVAEALVRWLRAGQSPDVTSLPVRVVVATASADDPRVIACAAEFSHMAVDYQAMQIVRREFAELVADPAARQLGGRRHQPLDQAELEATPTARRQAETTLCYWQDQLERMPSRLYATPAARFVGEPLSVMLSSAAGAMAVHRVAARTRASRSSVVFAAVCAVLARRTGYQELVLPLLSSNRFERHLADYVGTLAQGCVATVDLATGGFDALVRQAWTAVIESCRHGRYDAFERVEVGKRIEHERGLRFSYEPIFNNLVAESWSAFTKGDEYGLQQVTAALPRTRLDWRPVPNPGTPIRFDLRQLDGTIELDVWSADSAQVPREELESLLLAVERLLVAAAHDELDAARTGEVVGLTPIDRGPDWLLVDSCWVDLAEVQRLLDAALAPSVARIFPSVGGQPLVAYLTATESVRTPEQAHARCMAALSGHPTALTPRHYVICETTPADPANLTDWHTALTTGTGRT